MESPLLLMHHKNFVGCGFPDIATRAFLYQLVRCFNDQHSSHRDDYEAVFGRLSHDSSHQEHPRIPVLGLSDCNPFGLAIMLCYALGSKSNSHANQFCVPSLQWLGLRNEDIDTFDLPKSAIQVRISHALSGLCSYYPCLLVF